MKIAAVIICLTIVGFGFVQTAASQAATSSRVTAEIQAGIDRHVAEQVSRGGGYYHLAHGDKQLKLKLVRIHTEYLSKLGNHRFFACVDLADVSGDVYDVDFFLEGEPGNMTVTETTVHKINGQPYYMWNEEDDGTWIYTRRPTKNKVFLSNRKEYTREKGFLIGAGVLFFEDIGIELEPGECKQFRLVEVKP